MNIKIDDDVKQTALTASQKAVLQKSLEDFRKLSNAIDLSGINKKIVDQMDAINAFSRITSPVIQLAVSKAIALRQNDMEKVSMAAKDLEKHLKIHEPNFARAALEANKLGSMMAEQIAKVEFRNRESEQVALLPTPSRNSLRSGEIIVSKEDYIEERDEVRKLKKEVEELKEEMASQKVVTVNQDSAGFCFAGTITDFATGLMYKKGDSSNHTKLNRGKRRYLWEFMSTILGNAAGCEREDVDRFVGNKLGRAVKITNKDFEGLADTVVRFSTHPKEKVRECFVYREKVFLKKIG